METHFGDHPNCPNYNPVGSDMWSKGLRMGLAQRWKRDPDSEKPADEKFLKEKEVILCEELHKLMDDGKNNGPDPETSELFWALDMAEKYQNGYRHNGIEWVWPENGYMYSEEICEGRGIKQSDFKWAWESPPKNGCGPISIQNGCGPNTCVPSCVAGH